MPATVTSRGSWLSRRRRDANAKLDLLFRRRLDGQRAHCLLDVDRTPDRIDDASEFDEEAIAHPTHQPTLRFFDPRIDDLAPDPFEGGERAFLVQTHQP